MCPEYRIGGRFPIKSALAGVAGYFAVCHRKPAPRLPAMEGPRSMIEPPPPLLPYTALLLIAHGSRQEEANADLYHVVEDLKALGRYGIIEASFLEMARPDIMEGGELCA